MQSATFTTVFRPSRVAVFNPRLNGERVRHAAPIKAMAPEEAGVLSGEWAEGAHMASHDDIVTYFHNKAHPEPTAAEEYGGDADGVLSGEWPASWSLASYEDLGEYFKKQFFKQDTSKSLRSIMASDLITTTPETPLSEVADKFSTIGGLPVVDSEGTLVGVISKVDLGKAGATVGDVMNSKPIAAAPDARVQDAAVLMLKHKVHRIPIVDARARCVGIVSRTDIFTALAMDKF